MNTNVQSHTDLIWSLQFDMPVILIGIAAIVLIGVVLVAVARRRKKP